MVYPVWHSEYIIMQRKSNAQPVFTDHETAIALCIVQAVKKKEATFNQLPDDTNDLRSFQTHLFYFAIQHIMKSSA